MIKILFFARYRDTLNTAQLNLPLNQPSSVNDLVSLLAERGPDWKKVMSDEHRIIAVNQTVASLTTTLADGDEVAFYPPVTGG